MTNVRHLAGGFLHAPPGPRVPCHCLLLEDPAGLALVDAGIGRLDCADPDGRVGRAAIDAAGFRFDPADTVAAHVERLGFRPADVRDVLLTHADPDHAGGLADFPAARVHVSAEERDALHAGHPRYRPPQFSHGPQWVTHPPGTRDWFGLPARPVALGLTSEVLLVPLFGHTAGHCGVAVRQGEKWVLHAGDAYYLRAELFTDDHPVSALAAASAVDDAARRASLEHVRRLVQDHGSEVTVFGYHDPDEMPG